MARGSEAWTGLPQRSGCQPRRGTTASCSEAGLATSYAVWAASRSFAAFLASRVIGGISKGNVSLSTAIVADLGSPSARSRGMAVIGVAFSLGFTLGPMLGASLPAETVPWLALLFAASDLLFIFCFLPETLPPEKRAPSITPGFRAAVDLLSPLALLRFSAVARGQDPPAGDRLGSLRRLGLVYFLYLFLFSGLEYTLSFLAHQRFQFSSLQQGKMFFFIGLTMATVQGAYARRISPGGEIAAVKRAILLLVPAFLLIGWGLTLPVLGLGLLLYSFGEWVLPGPGREQQGAGSQESWVTALPGVSHQLPQSWCPACPLWLPTLARPGRRARSWAPCGAWAPWPGRWDPWWLPQCTGWRGPGSASPCALASSCSPSCSCGI
ncbi:major facilitator superfamily domain-containing protein 10 isoform X6 [Mirounga leonina]|uniref:major facilitator superfamily domain-containing protein 10 isoform X6 n=1 Tax=Mirounga leonina TaxID=9715 RepID=UPI00156BE9FA|nr:major facilitator superfamily domain-containing protein 10 isoform X6 [Mirounga leonina]